MRYNSTRNDKIVVNGPEAIAKGIAEDGGLFVPEVLPTLNMSDTSLSERNYQEIAQLILSLYFPEFKEEELREAVSKAYGSKFDTVEIAPIVSFDNTHIIELFHGPTLAFKDMALSVLPELMKLSQKELGQREKIVILTATSGDTGKAALEGFKNIDGIDIVVFYPQDGVSEMQKKQMTSEDGKNCFVAAVKGNFDDTQTSVKELFTSEKLNSKLKENGYLFSSANSINIGRLIPQIAYYVYGYFSLLKKGEIQRGEKINVCVPTGNFGNILAAFMAKEMGLPIQKFICASNENNVLTDFFVNGTYNKNRPFYTTTSPSMDILVSSNLERLLYFTSKGNTELVNKYMDDLKSEGSYSINETIRENTKDFYGSFTTQEEVNETIHKTLRKNKYLLDTHTAVAVHALEKYRKETQDSTPTLVTATASPFKFSESVCEALNIEAKGNGFFEESKAIAKAAGLQIPISLKVLQEAPVRFKEVFKKQEMEQVVLDFLDIK